MNWGKGLTIALMLFAGMMAWFVVMAHRNPEPLVTEEYYAEELKYQQRIDHTERALALSRAVRIDVGNDGVRLRFPAELKGKAITGELTLLRPNDPRADIRMEVKADSAGSFDRSGLVLVPGRYNAALEWTVDGERYFTEEKLVVQ
ncbi:MAG: FixH family protein [Flavobacteriales bacterium]